MKKIVVILVVFLCICYCPVFSQHNSHVDISPVDLKKARLAIYEWIDNYKKYGYNNQYDKRKIKTRFYSLFSDSSVNLVNDFLPSKDYNFADPSISLSKYYNMIESIRNSFYKCYSEVGEVEVLSEKLINASLLKYEIELEKIVWFKDKKDTIETDVSLCKSYCYPKDTLVYKINIDYNLNDKNAKATSISLVNGVDEFIVVHTEDAPYNEYFTKSDLSIYSDSLNEKSIPILIYRFSICDFDSKMYDLICDTSQWAICLGGVVGGGFIGEIVNNLYSDLKPKIKLNYAINFGCYKQLMLNRNNRVGIEFGLAYNHTNFNISNMYGDQYFDIDSDGGNYERIITVSDYDENITRCAMALPISIRYDRFFWGGKNSNIAFVGKLGFVPMYDFKQKLQAKANIQYSGYYDWMFGITIDQNDIYDFGNYDVEWNGNEASIERFSINSFLSVGLSYFLTKQMSFDASVAYLGTIYNGIKQDDCYHLSRNSSDWTSATWTFKRYSFHSFGLYVQYNYIF